MNKFAVRGKSNRGGKKKGRGVRGKGERGRGREKKRKVNLRWRDTGSAL